MSDLREDHAAELAEDREARRVAQTEFDRPVLLEAGAGTGKTTTLVARSLLWSLGRGWEEAHARLRERQPDEAPAFDRVAAEVLGGLVAITFTEAAAAEMAARVASALAVVARQGGGDELIGIDLDLLPEPLPPDLLARRAGALLGALDRLEVRTIHAYCHRLLVTWALEAGLHPEFRIDADGFQIEELAARVVEGQVRAAYASDHSDHPLVQLATLGTGPRKLVEAAAELALEAFSFAELARDPFAEDAVGARRDRLRRRLDAFVDAGGDRLRRAKRSKVAGETVAAVATTLDALDTLFKPGLEGAERLRQGLEGLWSQRCLRRLGDWAKGKLNKSERAALSAPEADAVAAAAAPLRRQLELLATYDPRAFDVARRALAPVVEELEGELRRAGIVSFATLLRDAVRLLAETPAARRRERRRIEQLLVDEFQDTDRRQCDLVRQLALEGPEEHRPGLFVVGDPKQTIYGWRNADLEAYEAFVTAAERAGGRRWSLVENFRSVPPLLEEVERTVKGVMIETPGLQPAFQPLLPCAKLAADPGHRDAGRAPVEHWTSAGSGGPVRGEADAAARLEAAAVAADVADLVASGAARYDQIGILLRVTTRVDAYLEALRAAAIPFAVLRDRQYYLRREIVEAAAAVRAVIHPADHLALVAWLRSSSVGVPDAAWIPLWERQLPRLVTDLAGADGAAWKELETAVRGAAGALPESIPGLDRVAGWEESLLAALAALADLRQAWRELPADRFLDQLRSTLLPEAAEAARFLGGYRLANLERFYRRLCEALDESRGDTQAVLRTLRRSIAEARESTERRPAAAAEEAVQVLTIHAAKGLEFDHLYLVQAGNASRGGNFDVADLDETRDHEMTGAYALFQKKGPDFDAVQARRDRVEDAERVRTLYVALTRARRRLVVVGSWPGETASHLELLRPRRADLAAAERAAIEELEPGGSHRDEHDALWRRLDPDLAPVATRAAAADDADGDGRELRRRVQAGRQLRRAARRHARRPYLQAASHEAGARLAYRMEPVAPGARGTVLGELDPHAATTTRRVALAVGDAIHRLFETWDHDNDPAAELEAQRERLDSGLASALPAGLQPDGLERAAALLERLERGDLLARFQDLGPAILARELPVIVPPDDGPADPVGAWSGAIDLLVSEPDTGRPLVIDFKTDRVEDGQALAARAAVYAPQARIYREAVRQGLGLDAPPRVELWFLWADRAVSVRA